MKRLNFWVFGVLISLLAIVSTLEAQENMNSLPEKEQKIVTVSACAARGDLYKLKLALADGLDHSVTVNEFKEILVQTYAYCGFPRSLNALAVFMELLSERGGKDVAGPLPGPLPSGTSLDFGTDNQTRLCGQPVKGPLFEFAPTIDEFLKAHLFGDIFARDNLDWRSREMATIAMLAAMTGVEPQLNAHIAIGKKNGLTETQIADILALVKKSETGGAEAANGGKFTTANYNPLLNPGPFPLGKENTGYAQYFSGKSYLAPLTALKELNVPMFNVTFEPCCRNN